jgi:hypothetical protein
MNRSYGLRAKEWKMRRAFAICMALALAACGTGNDGFKPDVGPDGVSPDDADGDTISDTDEGRFDTTGGTDTDGDGTPDYLDEDSDGDGIPDGVEAGDMDASSPPADSDGDGTPDFRDLDSDGNAILDGDEGMGDADGDGIRDFADLDNDGDDIDDRTEIGGTPSAPVDADGDTVPDYMDLDSDNDSITDQQERPADSDIDGDLVPDRHDLDTDGDGIPDATEAGDTDPHTWPRDTDGDGTPDFRDIDSDNDGLSDSWEFEHGLNPFEEDSDGDGVPDLIEVGAGTDPLDASSNPTTEGNFYFLVPYMEDPDPPEDTLVFTTDLQKADVFFIMDTTGSMGGAITNLQSTLSTSIIPAVAAIIPDVWFGVGRHDDYPYGGYGSSTWGDVAFQLVQRMTASATDAQIAVDSLDLHGGSDGEESQVPALWATATGLGLDTYLPPQDACASSEVGYPCFRTGSVPIVVLITDAPYHNGPGGYAPYSISGHVPPTYDEAVTALNAIHAKVIAVVAGGWGEAMSHATSITTDTGAVDVGGSPLLYTTGWDGTGLGSEIVDGIETMAHQVPIDVSAAARDDDTDMVDATYFIASIVPNVVGGITDPADPSIICVGGLPVDDMDGDTVLDTFVGILPGTPVCFDITPRMNDIIEATEEPQVFKAYIDVVGDGITVLDSRDVYFLIPPHIDDTIPG